MLLLGLPKCLTKAIYYRFNQAGLTETSTAFEKCGTPLKLAKMNVLYEILKEKYTHKEFDRITEFSFPEMVWASNEGGIYTDYLRKAEMNLFSDYLGFMAQKSSKKSSCKKVHKKIFFLDHHK